jgi:hypothetical protein
MSFIFLRKLRQWGRLNYLRKNQFMKRILLASFLCLTAGAAPAQSVGLSFSYFIPRNGDFSTPISPFSLRGVGIDLNRFLALETGASLYRMSGLNMTGLPFESTSSLTGPNFTVFIPGELVLQFKGKGLQFDVKGGGFFFYAFDQQLNYGNMDKALRSYTGFDVVNSHFDFDNKPGFGYTFGFEFSVDVTSAWGISLETNYLVGGAPISLTGGYQGGMIGGNNAAVLASFPDARVDFTGLEFSIGINFKTGRR